ncbi:MAG: isopeptide-forming domain-containing fimbrial protein [Eubacterium sp.]|nr:isopeptide-forming domain-containing fimbrial protein [Eubacterium sp.]
MKTFKKLTVFMLALILVLTMSVTVFAADEEPAYDYPLTVTGLAEGDTVKFYQVVEWVGETDDNSDVAGWKAVSAYDSVLTKDVLTSMLVGDPGADPAVAPTGMTSELAGQLAALATGGEDATSIASGTATYENATSGMYMALITPADADTVYNPVFVSADYNKETGHTGTVAVDGEFADGVAKSSTLTLTKTAEDKTTVDEDKEHTVAVGDVIDFTVTTQIPAYGKVYENPKFDVTDTLNGLELVGDSIEVTAGETTLTAGTDYTVDPDDYDGETSYTISFTKTYLQGLTAATPITITYDATVTVNAQNAINQTDNEVVVQYSHNPNDQDDYDVKKDTTQHYTFTIDAAGIGGGEQTSQHGTKTSELVKIGVDAAGNPITETTETSTIEDGDKETWEGPLEGAVFGLFTDAAGTTPLKDKDDNDVTATTGDDGRMTFAGLDAGTYYIKEISAPAGYVTNSDVYIIDIVAETEEVTVTETVEGKEVSYKTDVLKSYTVTITDKDGNATEAAKYTFENEKEASDNDIQWTVMECVEHPFPFTNVKGTELPSTGGIGTTIFYILGAFLVLGAGVLLVTRRRMGV